MAGTLQSLGNLVRSLAALGFVGLVGTGGYLGYQAYNRHFRLEEDLRKSAEQLKAHEATIGRLTAEIVAKDREIQDLSLAIRLLKVDRRMAEIQVLNQTTDADGKLKTTLEFVEVNDAGEPLDSPRQITIDGDVIYIDAWVVKYDDKLVESGNPLGSTSICLFRRLFSEDQRPVDGFQLDKVGAEPVVYRHGMQVSKEEQKIWARFWEYANNPTLAESAGVRAAHGEAPSIKLRQGKLYKVELRASGGLSIVAEDLPAERDPL
jgi:hypothetical protein